ncbi:MAG: alpha-L-fucosidase [Akkermansia sp.]|nr:alpha-L-fucosidase [Akkermansia sp.]
MMKIKALAIMAAAALLPLAQGQQVLPAAGDDNHAAVTETNDERDLRMYWWRQAKFGMFIHYGLYSGLAGEFKGQQGGAEWIQTNLGLDTDTYAAEALPLFQPKPGCTEAWADLAEKAGCRYMVLTSKHHDGFALFDSATSDYTSAKVLGRDIVKEFANSARKRGMRVGLYHSVIDWHHPAYDNTICPDLCYPVNQAKMLKEKGIPRDHATYQKYLHSQVRELMTNYGTIDIMWWDYSQGAAEGERGWKAPALMNMCRELNPGVIMNNRLYSFSGFDASRDGVQLDLRCGDYTTPEKRIPAKGYPGIDWESCMTVGDKWGYNRYDLNIKTPATVIRQLQQCAAKGGNLLLNINPMADGSIPAGVEEVFLRVGKWMEVNGESIYGSYPIYNITLPEGWMSCMVYEDTYLFPPSIVTENPVELMIPAYEIDTVEPEVVGQPDCKVTVERIELPGKDEPQVFMKFVIPAEAWQNAVEGLPVIKLINAH